MLLHIGMEKIIATEDIIGIFDIENTTVYKNTRDFLDKAQREGRVQNVCTDIPKTFIIVREKEGETVYISGISPSQLYKKAVEFLGDENRIKNI